MAEVRKSVSVRDLLFYAVHVHKKAYNGKVPSYFTLHPIVVDQLRAIPEARYELAIRADGSAVLWNGIQINESPRCHYPCYRCVDGTLEYI